VSFDVLWRFDEIDLGLHAFNYLNGYVVADTHQFTIHPYLPGAHFDRNRASIRRSQVVMTAFVGKGYITARSFDIDMMRR
jgi:hypothetical protein